MTQRPMLKTTTLLTTALAAVALLSTQTGCGGGGSTPALPTVLAHLYVLDKSGQVRVVELDSTGTLTLIDSQATTGTNPSDIDIDVSGGVLAVVSEPDFVDVVRLNANGAFGLSTASTITGITNEPQCVLVDQGVVFVGSSKQPATVLGDRGLIYSFALNATNLTLSGQITGTDLAYHSALEAIGPILVGASSGNTGFGRWTRTGQSLGPITSAPGPGSVYDIEPLASGCVLAGFAGTNQVNVRAYDGNWLPGNSLNVPGLFGRSDAIEGPGGRWYVVGNATPEVSTLALSGTTFTHQAGKTIAFAADGVAVDPTGQFIVVSDKETSTLQAVPIDQTTLEPDVTSLPAALVIGGSQPTKMIAVAP
jgi:hypothetical protein